MYGLDIMSILFSLPGVFIAFSFHEFAHAYVAYRLGDDTAKLQGRLTLDPLAHIDPIGFFSLLLFRFGWAKPVPVNPLSFKNRKTGMILVSLAGPLMNLFLALISMIIYMICYYIFNIDYDTLYNILINMYYINISLFVFNLIPIPPLDGSKILAGLLPSKQEFMFYKYEHYSQILLLILIFTDIIDIIITPVFNITDIAISNIITLLFSSFM